MSVPGSNGHRRPIWTPGAEHWFKHHLRTYDPIPASVARLCCEIAARIDDEPALVTSPYVVAGLRAYETFAVHGVQPFPGIHIATRPPYTVSYDAPPIPLEEVDRDIRRAEEWKE